MDDVDTSKAVTQTDSAVAGTATPLASVTPPAPITPPELTTLKCPSCEATLQKVSITPGVKINCLHCGAKFFPPNANGTAAAGEPAVGELAAPTVREPKSPGYWLLRVPAAIALFAGFALTALLLWSLRKDMRLDVLERWWGMSYIPLITISGVFAFLWSRSLARIDAGWTHRFWKMGLLREPLPPMPGSSLPYIAPLAVVGGFFPVFMFAFGDENGNQVVTGGIFGAVLFLLGFMAEDIRQFAWRERATAEKIEPPTILEQHHPYGEKTFSWTGTACAAGFGFLSLLEVYVAYDTLERYGRPYYNWGRSELMLYLCLALGFAASAVTGFMLCRDWDRATASWTRVAAKLKRRRSESVLLASDEFPARGLIRLVHWLPIAWAIYGIVWMLLSAMYQQNHGVDHLGLWFLMTLSCIAAAGWFSHLILQISRWRQAKQTACAELLKEPAPSANSRVLGWPGMVVRLTMLLTVGEALLFGAMLLKEVIRFNNRWDEFFAIPLILGIIHYPTLWIATLVSEFLAMENSATAQKPLDE